MSFEDGLEKSARKVRVLAEDEIALAQKALDDL